MSNRYGRDFSLAIDFTNSIRLEYGINRGCQDIMSTLRYYKALVKLTINDGSYEDYISTHEAAFLISDTVWSPAVQNTPKLRTIADIASYLELPIQNQVEYESRWNKMVNLIDSATQDQLDKPG